VSVVAEFRIERSEGQYVWRLVGDGGRKVADSGEGFLTVEAARESIEQTRAAAQTAEVVNAADRDDQHLDEAGEESFPASDPPSAWARRS
jgi:uncharacterized protein YegP (UPF0339 family)